MKHTASICSFVLGLMIVLSSLCVSQPSALQNQPLTPLGQLLNPDGTLKTNTGFNGSLDPRGWSMVKGENGQPQFTRSAQAVASDPADVNWDSTFAVPGVNSFVSAIAVSGSDVYVGGSFILAGTVTANHVAKWNGNSWSALGSGTDGGISALAIIGTDLYAGGQFTMAGGSSANYIAKWDGSSWSALGSGMDYIVTTFAVVGTDLFAGGGFTTAGGSSANHIAKWNGSSWSALGSGLNSSAYALAVIGTDLYAGGVFSTAGGSSANRIAKWDGSSWSALGTGMNGAVTALAVSGTDLFAGGGFTTAGGSSANYVAKWNGSSWSALGTGMSSTVYALAASGTDLYAGGLFVTAGGTTVNNVAKWNGSSWSALVSGTNFPVNTLAVAGTDLYAGGQFNRVGTLSANYIAKWNGSAWSTLGQGNGATYVVYSFVTDGNTLYAGGGFNGIGIASANSVAKWDGSNWSALGSGVDNYVNALAIIGTDLYVAGEFTTAGGSSANYIAKWDGSNWSALGSGLGASVHALAVIGTDLYVGGNFITAGGSSANHVAKWNGSTWSALGSGVDNIVTSLVASGTDLYVGGYFSNAGGSGANRIAKWDGSNWSALGTGTNASVKCIAIDGSDLYAGGEFITAGGVNVYYIAKWDGSNWSAMGSGMGGLFLGGPSVSSIAVKSGVVYAGGTFTTAGGTHANYVASWDGSTWSPLGSGTDGTVYAVQASGTSIFAGGSFTSAGSKQSTNIGRWTPPASFSTVPTELAFGSVLVGSSKQDSVAVTNPSGASLNITDVSSDDPVFSVTPSSATIGSGGSQEFYITFAPTAIGVQSGNIIFTHSGPSSPDTVTVTGTGYIPFSIVKRKDTDGNAATTGDQTPKSWVLSLYKGTIDPDSLIALGDATESELSGNLPASGVYIACEADSGSPWRRINGNQTRYDTFTVSTTALRDTFINFLPNTITIRKFKDSDGDFNTSADRQPELWCFYVHQNDSLGDAVATQCGVSTMTLDALPDGTYYIIEDNNANWIRLGYVLDGTPIPSLTYGVTVTVADGQTRTIDFVNAPPIYSQLFRTATMAQWALDPDKKGKQKLIKAKPDSVHFKFNLVTRTDTLNLSFPQTTTGRIFSNKTKSIVLANWSLLKKITFIDPPFNPGDTIQIEGTGLKGKAITVDYSWSSIVAGRAKVILKGKLAPGKVPLTAGDTIKQNQLLLPMPNLHNIGTELFTFKNAFQAEGGLLIGEVIPDSIKKLAWVLHKKYTDVQKSLNKRGLLHPSLGTPFLQFSNGSPMKGQLSSLAPDKGKNGLFAEAVALGMNLAASDFGQMPAGLGDLIIQYPSPLTTQCDSVIEGMTIREFYDNLRKLLTNKGRVWKGVDVTGCPNWTFWIDLLNVAHDINGAFSGPNDTASWSGVKVQMTGVKRLIDVPFLHASPGPVAVPLVAEKTPGSELPLQYELRQNYPNPFNPTTTIEFALPEASMVTLTVYNILGQQVAELVHNELMDEGAQEVVFDASDLSSGVYFYRLTTEPVVVDQEDGETSGKAFTTTRKMLLVR